MYPMKFDDIGSFLTRSSHRHRYELEWGQCVFEGGLHTPCPSPRCGGKWPRERCVPGGHTCQYLPRKKKEAQTVGERELLDNVGVEEIKEREPTSCTECRSRHVKYNKCRLCERCVLRVHQCQYK